MKSLKRIIILIIIGLIVIASLEILSGYKMYKIALIEVPLEQKIEEIKSDENYTKIEDMADIYKEAVVATEDHRFYNHGAIDVIAMARAIITDIRYFSFIEGGSTITQQLSKNIYFTQERTAKRKIAEIFMAYKIEEKCSKNQILELYVNTSYFGDGYYNIREASKGYYGKEPINLNMYEATILAGVPNAPSVYSPTNSLKLAEERQNQVIYSLLKYKYIKQDEAQKIKDMQKAI